jgi:phage replication-related protein YjqB (UPF0714/DUF867 family)
MVSVEVGLAQEPQKAVNKKSCRCSISRDLARKLEKGVDDHIRVETSGVLNGYYRIKSTHSDTDYGLKISRHERGLSRLNLSVGDTVDVLPTVPVDDTREAFPVGDLAETFWDLDGSQVFISCPHGGDIEYNTDEMGQYLFKQLTADGIPSTAWILHGYYSGLGKDATERWHVNKPVKGYDAYPGLRKLKDEDRNFKYGIGFHIQKADHVGVGGMADREVREMIADAIRGPVPSKYDVKTDYDEMKLTGKGTSLSMNHFAKDYQGIQIEMPYKVAYNKFHSLPEAVADVFTELL